VAVATGLKSNGYDCQLSHLHFVHKPTHDCQMPAFL
jgi:hypothetical protein